MPSSTAVVISPARAVRGQLRVPGDKSISHRYALLAALAHGRTKLSHFAPGTDGHAPLMIHGTRLRGILYRPSVPSAQVKSAILLAGLHANGATSVTEPAPTRDHTERALAAFGGQVAVDGSTISVDGEQHLAA